MIDGKAWPTSKHYFQAMKFNDPKIREEIRNAPSAREVYNLANSTNGKYKNKIRWGWNLIKDRVIHDAVWAKFTQDPALKQELIATGNATLIEESPTDSYWGTGGKRKR
jgi:ribA/ribD-fused uncharacterized protein